MTSNTVADKRKNMGASQATGLAGADGHPSPTSGLGPTGGIPRAAFTPGPWVVGTAQNFCGFYVAPAGRLPVLAVAEAVNYPGSTEANARLIAAAPDLYEALTKVADSLEAELQARYPVEAEGHSPYPDMKRRYDRDMAEVHEARAALAKARGEA